MFNFLLAMLATAIWFQGDPVTAFKVTGAIGGVSGQSGSLPRRLEINAFASSGPPFDLYILALQAFQSINQTEELSYFQIAGIHGYPVTPWDGVIGSASAGVGYCMHNSILFPVWHRPYLAAFEQVLWTHAQIIASQYPPSQRVLYQNAALTMRVPFWDWAIYPSLPAVATSPTITVTTPSGAQEIKNPLYRYDFHPVPVADGAPPGQFFSDALFTTRWPDSSSKQSNDSAATDVMRSNAASISSATYQLLASVGSYTDFASTSANGETNTANNIENIHNLVHSLVGGPSGFMTAPGVAAFDPIFWLHHAQVDRLVAMWQALNPSAWIAPAINTQGSYYEQVGTVDSDNSSLAPFHSDNDQTMYTPETVRDIAVLGYIYPELAGLNGSQAGQQATLRSRINVLYNNPIADQEGKQDAAGKKTVSIAEAYDRVTLETAQSLRVNNLEQQWSIRVTVDHCAYNTTLLVDFFMGTPPDNVSEWATARNLIGTYSQFVLASPVAMPGNTKVGQVQGEVSLTHSLAAGVSRGFLADLSPENVVPLLKTHLHWRARTPNGSDVDLKQLRGLTVFVQSRTVTPSQNVREFPTYGTYMTHVEATKGQAGGGHEE